VVIGWYETRQPEPLTIAVHQGVEGIVLKRLAKRFSDHQKTPVQVVEYPYEDLYKNELGQVGKSRRNPGADSPDTQENAPKFDVMMAR
jgi:hypothetical protein